MGIKTLELGWPGYLAVPVYNNNQFPGPSHPPGPCSPVPPCSGSSPAPASPSSSAWSCSACWVMSWVPCHVFPCHEPRVTDDYRLCAQESSSASLSPCCPGTSPSWPCSSSGCSTYPFIRRVCFNFEQYDTDGQIMLILIVVRWDRPSSTSSGTSCCWRRGRWRSSWAPCGRGTSAPVCPRTVSTCSSSGGRHHLYTMMRESVRASVFVHSIFSQL